MLILEGILAVAVLGFDWKSDLHPEGKFRLLWHQAYETTRDVSQMELSAKGGVFPDLQPWLKTGVELSTAGTNLDSRPDRVTLAGGMSDKTIALGQAYLDFVWKTDLLESHAFAGKFESPLFYSPLLWDHEIRPEGLLESVSFNVSSEPEVHSAFYAGQFSVDQVSESITNGTPMRRSWLFEQGILGSYRSAAIAAVEVSLAFNFYYFADLSERVANLSGQRGNSIIGTIGNNPKFRYHFAPIENVLQISAVPLGIRTGLLGAFAINFRTPDKQRSFFVQADIGNVWRKRNFVGSLSYYYNEPNTSVALFSDADYGYANRKGPRAEVSYFVIDRLRLGMSFALLETLADSVYQANRKEFYLEAEARFF